MRQHVLSGKQVTRGGHHGLCPTVFVAGLSMGAIMTLYLGEVFPEIIRGIVPINGGVYVGNPDLARMAFRRDLPDIVPSWDDSTLLRDRSVTEVAYQQMARSTIVDVLGLAKVVEKMLPELAVPVVILQSKGDRVMPPGNAQYMAERVGSGDKEIIILQNSNHVATMDHDKDIVAEEIIGFIKSHA